jgi:pyruvate/2-oxoglutarate dehydrogenase complex dihydrolipoamide acyltransferase (E2) component
MRSLGLVCCGRIEKKALVVDNEIKIQDVINFTCTTDHRYGDAATFAPFNKGFKGYLKDPANYKPEDYKQNIHWSEKAKAK